MFILENKMGRFLRLFSKQNETSRRRNRMRPTKLTKNILLFFSIIAVLLAVNSLVERDNVYSSHNKTSKKTEHSAYTGIDIHTAVTEETTYNMSIHYPEF